MSWPILVVEDDLDIRETTAHILAARGYRVATAPDGHAALELMAAGFRPAVVILDLMMPVMDGGTLLEHMAASPELGRIPVVVITAQPSEGRRLAHLVEEVLVKPFDLRRLLSAISELCGQTSTRKAPGSGPAARRVEPVVVASAASVTPNLVVTDALKGAATAAPSPLPDDPELATDSGDSGDSSDSSEASAGDP